MLGARGPPGILSLRDSHASAAKTLLRLPRSPKFITASRYKPTRGESETEREKEKRSLHGDTLALLFMCAFRYA